METRRLGSSDPRVSVVGLGCNNFGSRVDEAGTRAVVDAALEVGVTFFDTADVYGDKGGSETLLGKVLEGRRDEVVLATKFGGDMGDGTERHGSRAYVRSALAASLDRLQTDRVDLYQHHQEDRGTPLEETFGALKELVDEGRVRAVGTSNYEPDRLEDAAKVLRPRPAVRLRAERVLVAAPRSGERAAPDLRAPRPRVRPVLPACVGPPGRQGRARPSAGGGNPPARARARRCRPRSGGAARRLGARARRHPLDVAIGGLLAVAPVVSVIAGATKPEQVRANAAAGAWAPTADELSELRAL